MRTIAAGNMNIFDCAGVGESSGWTGTGGLAAAKPKKRARADSSERKEARKNEKMREERKPQGRRYGRGREEVAEDMSTASDQELSESSTERRRPSQKQRKRRRSRSASSSESEDSTLGEPSSSSDGGAKRKRGHSGKGSTGRVHWDLVNAMRAFEDRLRHLQDRKVVASMTIMEISQFKDHFEKEEQRKGGGAIFGKDHMLKAKRFKGEVDNGREKLHQARFNLRMPISLPKQ